MSGYIATFKKYVAFSGRASRKEYWMFILISVAIFVVLSIVLPIIGGLLDSSGSLAATLSCIPLVFYIAVALPFISVSVRRMHDVGRPGWWIIIPIAPLIFSLQQGTAGDNAYGPAPTA